MSLGPVARRCCGGNFRLNLPFASRSSLAWAARDTRRRPSHWAGTGFGQAIATTKECRRSDSDWRGQANRAPSRETTDTAKAPFASNSPWPDLGSNQNGHDLIPLRLDLPFARQRRDRRTAMAARHRQQSGRERAMSACGLPAPWRQRGRGACVQRRRRAAGGRVLRQRTHAAHAGRAQHRGPGRRPLRGDLYRPADRPGRRYPRALPRCRWPARSVLRRRRLVTDPDHDQSDVAALADGGFVVTRTRHNGGGDNNVSATMFNADGSIRYALAAELPA